MFAFGGFVERHISIEHQHDISYAFRFHLVDNHAVRAGRSLPVDSFQIIARFVLPQTEEFCSNPADPRGNCSRPWSHVSRSEFSPTNSFGPGHYRQCLWLKLPLEEIEAESISNTNPEGTDHVMSAPWVLELHSQIDGVSWSD